MEGTDWDPPEAPGSSLDAKLPPWRTTVEETPRDVDGGIPIM